MMAARPGPSHESFDEGLQRQPAQSATEPVLGREAPARGEGRANPESKQDDMRQESREEAGCGPVCSYLEPRAEQAEGDNFLETLPPEILIMILSYLDASSLVCVSHVSKYFHQVANDNITWKKLYMSVFRGQMWKPKLTAHIATKDSPVEDQQVVSWKMMYFKALAGQEVNDWKKELRAISPHTGLPRQTERLLRRLNVSWELTVRDRCGQEVTLEQSRLYFFQSSAFLYWSGASFASCEHINNIRLHGIRKEAENSCTVRGPKWRSLILNVDVKIQPRCFIGENQHVMLMHPSLGVIIGFWKGQSKIAFIMISLHFHKLVERSLLGSPACLDSQPVDHPVQGILDPQFSSHIYSLHFVLHNTCNVIMSRYFQHLQCHTVQIQRGLMELKVIHRTDFSQHRLLTGQAKLPWKSEDIEGFVENCSIMTLTLLDEFHKPLWCTSSPISITLAKRRVSLDYGGKHFLMEHQEPDGLVKMRLVLLEEQRQFLLISLTLYVSIAKVNKHFSTNY